MKKIISFAVIALAVGSFFLSNTNKANAVKPSDYGLKEGDLISAIFSDDPDVYIINDSGYKRLFLNPEIFKFYGHLGGFFNIKLVTPEVRDSFVTSGLFRDCESNDQKVYGVDVSGEDSGQLHWVNTSGAQAVADDPNFFKKVFCINNAEFNWYPKGNALGTVKDVPDYERMGISTTTTTMTTTVHEEVTISSSIKEIGQVVICHYPPDNPSNPQTITVDASALKAHLEHGDSVGICSGTVPVPTPTPTLAPTPVPAVPASGAITVVFPNGGEVLQKGTTQIIKWSGASVSKVYIKLRKGSDTYSMPEGMITDVVPNVGGYFSWTVPTTLPDGNDYAVRIVDGNYTGGYDDSDAPFSIVTIATQTPTPTPVSTPTPIPTPSLSVTPTPTPISCAPITVSLSPSTPQLQNASPGQSGVPLVIFNVATNCNLNLNSFAVSLLPMPNGYQNISSLRLYNNATGVQLSSTITVSGAGLNFTGLNQAISANQTLSLKVVGDISSSAVNGSTVYAVFGGSSATDAITGNFVGNNASGNLIIGNVTTIVASTLTTTPAPSNLDTLTIGGRFIDTFTRLPVANVMISTGTGNIYSNANGEFSFSTTTTDVTMTNPKGIPFYINCYLQLGHVAAIFRNSDNSLYLRSFLFDLVNGDRTINPLTTNNVALGDIPIWPAKSITVNSDIPVALYIGYPEEGRSVGSSLKTPNSLSNVVPLEYNTTVRLTDGTGNVYYSPVHRFTLQDGCSQAVLNFSGGQFAW